MKKKLRKFISEKELITVTIETVNGYFSLTGTTYSRRAGRAHPEDCIYIDGKRYIFESGGCIHEEIEEHFPELKPLIDLHLSDLDGTPLYAVENGLYWFRKDKRKGLNYIRAYNVPTKEIKNDEYFLNLIEKMRPVWKKQAEKALNQIKNIENE